MNAAVAYHLSRQTILDAEHPRHLPARATRRALPGLGITVLTMVAATLFAALGALA